MSTGGMALLLSPTVQPHTFTGLKTIGKIVYIFDLATFTTVSLAISYRFTRWRGTFTASLTHPTESLFAATALLSSASIIAGMSSYGVSSISLPAASWLVTTYRVLFWIYVAITFIWAIGAYTLLFTSPALKIQDMTPAWDLPIFPFMLSGTIAASGAEFQPADQAVPMIVAGLTAQGLGFIMSILMYASYIRRMVQYGFPNVAARPAMFIAVGPPAFTTLTILGLANDWPRVYINYFGDQVSYPTDFLNSQQQQLVTIHILRVLATMSAVFMWSLSAWFFAIAVIACLQGVRQMKFKLNWWAFVFPNVGFTIATISLGKTFESEGVKWVGSIMTIGIVAMWLFVAANHIRAVWNRDILWEGKDEDVYMQVGAAKIERAESRRALSGAADVEKQD